MHMHDDLSTYDQAYQEAEPASKGARFQPIPPGRYMFSIDSAELGRWPKSGEHYLEYKLRVLQGPHASRYEWKRSAIREDHQTLARLKTELRMCGVDVPPSALRSNLARFAGVQIAGAVALSRQTNERGERYRNVYFNRRVSVLDPKAQSEDTDAAKLLF